MKHRLAVAALAGAFIIFILFVNASFATYRVMLLGDSITKGEVSGTPVGGFRDDLDALLQTEGIDFNFVGTLTDGTGFDADHEGHNGMRADEIADNLLGWLNALGSQTPRFILVHAGTNDLTAGQTVESTIDDIEEIVDIIRTKASFNNILLCSLIPRKDDKDGLTTQLNQLIKDLYYEKKAAGYNIYYVGQNEVFKTEASWATTYMADDVHPNNAGFNVMAKVYFNVLLNAIYTFDNSLPVVSDYFARINIGNTWVADPEFQIVSNELANTATGTDWSYLATYVAQTNPTTVEIQWSPTASDIAGIAEGGLALMLNSPSTNASGYLCWYSSTGIRLWTIVNGATGEQIQKVTSTLPPPAPGDRFAVQMLSDESGHHFTFYLNGQEDVTLTDALKKQGNSSKLYAGVMLKGNLQNNVNYFNLAGTIQAGPPDTTPPAAISNLTAGTPTGSSIKLNWTAVGDDGATGRATVYDVRYSTSAIATDAEFTAATQATGEPAPANAGTAESFVVNGLSPNTTYNFRVKVGDEVPNFSDLSNSANAKTTESSGDFYTDDFNRTTLGTNWSADAVYGIQTNELSNTDAVYQWGNIAICTAVTNPTEVSFVWGTGANAAGIEEGGMVLRLNSGNPAEADGYFIWLRPSNKTINLFLLTNGDPATRIGTAVNFNAGINAPVAGNEFKVLLSSDTGGHHFDCYLNDEYVGRISDPEKLQGNGTSLLAGVNLKGGTALNNNVDNFTVSSAPVDDAIPPAKITNLVVSAVTSRSADLSWTAVGDDGTTGVASSYDVRYSISPITTNTNFTQATQAADAPTPAAAGTNETFTVRGLQPSTTYYFAIKAIDDASNQSEMSNTPSATTPAGGGFQFVDDFNRTDLGPNWVADPEYKITNNELENSATTGSWEYLAIFKGRKNVSDVSIQWGQNADAAGIEQGGLALMLGKDSLNASGYALWIRPSNRTLNLFRIQSGIVTTRIGSAVAMNSAAATPIKGAVFKVQVSTNATGHHFDCFVDNVNAGQISDPSKLYGNGTDLYCGVALKGNLNNNVDNFTVSAPLGFMEYVSGNNQTGSIGESLPEPLVILLKDTEQSPLPLEPVEFSVVQGSATLSPMDKINIEAESSTLYPNMQVGSSENASGGLYIYGASGNPYQGRAEYTFNIAEESTYVIWTRVYAPSGQEDSFFFVVDGSADTTLFDISTPYATWRWKQLEDRTKGKFRQILTAGEHTLSIVKRENMARLDKIIITSDQSFVPSGFQSGTTNLTINSNTVGNAGAYVTFGNAVGIVKITADAAGFQGSPQEFNLTARGGDAVKIEYVSGNNQSGRAGQLLTNPFVVQLYDIGNNPVPGWPVEFVGISGGGFPSNTQPVMSDNNGRASTQWTLGTESPNNVVNAVSAGLTGSPIVFNATATSGFADSIVVVSGNGQSGIVGYPLPAPFKVKIIGSDGSAIQNQLVKFKVTDGNGTVSNFSLNLKGVQNPIDTAPLNELEVLSDASGFAQVLLTLGDTVGVENNIVEVTSTVGGLPLKGSPFLFKATANPDVPYKLMLVSGNSQTGAANRPLGAPFVAKVADQYGNGIGAQTVNFEVKQGGGTLNPAGPWLTEAGGLAQVTLTLGSQAGQTNEVWATAQYNSVPLQQSPIVFQAISGNVTSMTYVAGNGQTGSAGYPVADSLKVKILDNFGNPVSGYPVTYSSSESTNPGTFNGASNQVITINTNADGIAKVSFSCGAQWGVASVAKAIAEGLSGSPISFSTNVANLTSLQYVSGNGQTGTVGMQLSEPFKVRVIDALGNSFANYKVTYTVKSGGGNFSGNPSIDVYTNAQTKVAETKLTLGPTPGSNTNIAEAAAIYKGNPLGSPISFTASSTAGSANELAIVSGNYASGVVGNQLEVPFVVRVRDIAGNPIVGHSVTFTVKTGNGKLDGFTLTTVTKQTGSNGQTQAYLTVGLAAGINNNSVEVVSYRSGTTTHLVGSPLTFYASGLSSPATQLKYVSGNGQPVSAIRTALSQPFRVKVTDSHENPVPDHPVKWICTQGRGTFENISDTIKTKMTDQNGFAQVTYYPGPVAGLSNQVIAQSWNGPELSGSPITFVVETKAAAVSPTISQVVGTGPVPADGVSQSIITVTLTDNYSNKIPGKALSMIVSGANNFITPFTSLTDENGQATAYLASTRAELKEVSIIDISDGVTLQNKATIRFTPLAARSISYVSGTNQSSNFGTACQNAIKARVTDMHGNVIFDYPVIFEAYLGGGSIYEVQPAKTDSNGYASAYWILGMSGEVNRARAVAEGLSGSPVEYIATAHNGTASQLQLISGNEQTGVAGYSLPQALIAKVADGNGDPISNYPVKFSVDFGGGNFNGNSSADIYTDVFGYARGIYTLGRIAGPNIASAEAQELAGSPKRFTAMGVAGSAQKIAKHSGDLSTVQINGGRWIYIKVTDVFDNPVSDYSVNFSVIVGDAQIRSGYEVATSNADGLAGSIVDAGLTLGEIKVLASAPGLIGDGLKFTLKSVARSAVLMEIYHGNNQDGTVGRELVYPLSVVVRDDYGNAAGGQNIPITFSLVGEKGILLDPQPVYSDKNGIASTRLTLEETAGNFYKVWAIKNGLTGSPVEFNATGVTNQFPLFDPIADYTINENQLVTFTVRATDGDGDPITYGLRNVPQGAQFDSIGSKQFSWRPDYFQAGEYTVNFMARDNKGGLDDEPVLITVENVNRAPQIINYEPIAYQVVGHKNIAEIFRFMVQVVDADNEDISYQWLNNDVLVSTKNYYDCEVSEQTLYGHLIVVKVTDGYDTVEHDWSLYIKTPVELANFSGEVVEFKGIELKWETTSEYDLAGFNVYRKSSADSRYEKLNSELLMPDGSKEYKYVDPDVKVGFNYNYKLEDVSISGNRIQHESISVFVEKPKTFSLAQNYPNPFNSNTSIKFQLPDHTHLTLKIYNILGQEVRTLVDQVKEAGYHTIIWNGLDNYDNQVSSGIYYYRLESKTFVQSKKMVYLK